MRILVPSVVHRVRNLCSTLALVLAASSGWAALAQPVTIEYVTVGNPANKPDEPQGDPPAQFGAVTNTFRISKNKVTAAQYAAFLNARAASDPFGLYSESMEITRSGSDGSYTYAVQEGKANRPIRWVEPVDALRFCNWLNNGGLPSSDTESGAYTFADAETPGPRNSGAKVFLPNENEWYKAAYYDPTKDGTGGYWLYAVRADEVTADPPPGGPHSANFDAVNRDNGETTDVGAYSSASSFYGTFDQTGNTWEWLEPDPATPDMSRRRSGSWENAIDRLSNDQTGVSSILQGGTQHQGFRVAAAAVQDAPRVVLTVGRTKDGVVFSWSAGNQLETAAEVRGPWSAVTTASSPLTVKPEEAHRYYRAR